MTVNMLWLYDDLLDLYGDCGNLLVLTRRLAQMGIETSVERASIADEPDFSRYQLVYIGPGKARNLRRAAEHVTGYRKPILECIKNGTVFLVTGNARLLLGKSYRIERAGAEPEEVACLGLLPYTGVETGDVFISDVICTPTHETNAAPTYGFINRTSYIIDNPGPYWFTTQRGASDAAEPGVGEGNAIGNVFSTWLLGPVLCKNPHLVREVIARLCPDAPQNYDDTLAMEAWRRTIADFEPKK